MSHDDEIRAHLIAEDEDMKQVYSHNKKKLVAKFTSFNTCSEVCDFINRHELRPQNVLSVNNDGRGNWWLIYF